MLVQADTQANQIASAINRAGIITNFTDNCAGKSFIFFYRLKRDLSLKSRIVQNIPLLLFICKIHVILYCKVLKIFKKKMTLERTLQKRIIFIGQMFWFWRIKNMVSKFMHSSVTQTSDFNEAFIPYNEFQFFDWPSIVAHSPAGLMYIAYGLVILVHRNILLTTITIGYIKNVKELIFLVTFSYVRVCWRRADLSA